MKFFIYAKSLEDYIVFVKTSGLNPLKTFYCSTKEQAISDSRRIKMHGAYARAFALLD